MSEEFRDRRLVSISTLWGVVIEAHDPQSEAARRAQQQLLERYGGAVRNYLLKSLRSEEAANDLYQEFALRLLRGDYRNVDPTKGRFRDYLKTVLFHLIGRFRKQGVRLPKALPEDMPEPAVESDPSDGLDAEFLDRWRDGLLTRCWSALAQAEQQGGQPYDTVLRFRGANPAMSSTEMAEQLSARLARPLSSAAVRQMLHRARERFAELLVDEVAQSLLNPTDEQLADELIHLGLYSHCEAVFQKRDASPPAATKNGPVR